VGERITSGRGIVGRNPGKKGGFPKSRGKLFLKGGKDNQEGTKQREKKGSENEGDRRNWTGFRGKDRMKSSGGA